MSIEVNKIMHGPTKIEGGIIDNADKITVLEEIRAKPGEGRVYHGKWDKSARLNPDPNDSVPEIVLVKDIDVTPANQYLVDMLIREDRLLRLVLNPQQVGPKSHGHIETDLPDGTKKTSLVMEDIAGDTLQNMFSEIDNYQLWSPQRKQHFALEFGIEAATELARIQQAGIIHRDIKPENIIFDKYTRKPRIIDFGAALTISQYQQLNNKTDANLKSFGTDAYTAPEQAYWNDPKRTIDYSTDVYALALTIAEIMGGYRPTAYNQNSGSYDARKVSGDILAYLTQTAPNNVIPPGFRAVLLKALEPDQANRYRNAAEFLVALSKVRII